MRSFSIIDKLGDNIEGSKSIKDALEQAGLDWKAKEAPAQYVVDDGSTKDAGNLRVLYRSDDGGFLGLVGSKYSVIQNEEAFAVADSLVANGMTFVRGGQFGSQTVVTLRGADSDIDGDVIKNYVSLRNSFDGTSKMQFAWIPVRQVCENGLCVEIPGVRRTFEFPHTGSFTKRYAQFYIEEKGEDVISGVKAFAKSLMSIKIKPEELTGILDKFFPVNTILEPKKVGKYTNTKNLQMREEIAIAMGQVDLANYNGTAYQVFQAFCDFETHSAGVISKKPHIAARQQFARAFANYSITQQVANMLYAKRNLKKI